MVLLKENPEWAEDAGGWEKVSTDMWYGYILMIIVGTIFYVILKVEHNKLKRGASNENSIELKAIRARFRLVIDVTAAVLMMTVYIATIWWAIAVKDVETTYHTADKVDPAMLTILFITFSFFKWSLVKKVLVTVCFLFPVYFFTYFYFELCSSLIVLRTHMFLLCSVSIAGVSIHYYIEVQNRLIYVLSQSGKKLSTIYAEALKDLEKEGEHIKAPKAIRKVQSSKVVPVDDEGRRGTLHSLNIDALTMLTRVTCQFTGTNRKIVRRLEINFKFNFLLRSLPIIKASAAVNTWEALSGLYYNYVILEDLPNQQEPFALTCSSNQTLTANSTITLMQNVWCYSSPDAFPFATMVRGVIFIVSFGQLLFLYLIPAETFSKSYHTIFVFNAFVMAVVGIGAAVLLQAGVYGDGDASPLGWFHILFAQTMRGISVSGTSAGLPARNTPSRRTVDCAAGWPPAAPRPWSGTRPPCGTTPPRLPRRRARSAR